jgi:hypothetical protein
VLALCQWPLWKVEVQTKTRHDSLEYKYVRVREDGTIGQWEPVENRCTPSALRRACVCRQRERERASERGTLHVGRPACRKTARAAKAGKEMSVCGYACIHARVHAYLC